MSTWFDPNVTDAFARLPDYLGDLSVRIDAFIEYPEDEDSDAVTYGIGDDVLDLLLPLPRPAGLGLAWLAGARRHRHPSIRFLRYSGTSEHMDFFY